MVEYRNQSALATGLAGRAVLVTGGSSGIGRAVATAFGREGARVALTFRTNESGAVSQVREIEAGGGTALARPFELGSEGSARALVDGVVEAWGGIDVL